MKKVNLTCVECPIGCDITVELDGKTVLGVKGNNCPRGKKYAENEVVCPVRVLTTTVRAENGKMIPVKTNEPIKKENIFHAMSLINNIIVKTPVKVGQVVLKDIYDGIDVVVCMDVD